MTNSSYDLTKDLDKVVVFDREVAVIEELPVPIEDTKLSIEVDLSKSTKEVLTEVGDNKELAIAYLEEEKKSEKPRTTLIKKLEEIAK